MIKPRKNPLDYQKFSRTLRFRKSHAKHMFRAKATANFFVYSFQRFHFLNQKNIVEYNTISVAFHLVVKRVKMVV